MEFEIAPRHFAEIDNLPPLAALQVGAPTVKPRGARRVAVKLARAAFGLLHEHLGIPARAQLRLRGTDGTVREVTVDARQRIWIDYASRARHGGYEPAETALVDLLLPRVTTFFDIGANWGYYSLLAATNRAFHGTVHSFEIAPAMIRTLESLTARADAANVVIHPYGLSERTGAIAISRERNAHLTRVIGPGARGIAVPVRRLDDLDLPPPDLVKIDVEDHERQVLAGGGVAIARHTPAILFECRAPQAADTQAVFSMLEGLGYRFHRFSFDAAAGRLTLVPLDRGSNVAGPGNLFAATEARAAALFS